MTRKTKIKDLPGDCLLEILKYCEPKNAIFLALAHPFIYKIAIENKIDLRFHVRYVWTYTKIAINLFDIMSSSRQRIFSLWWCQYNRKEGLEFLQAKIVQHYEHIHPYCSILNLNFVKKQDLKVLKNNFVDNTEIVNYKEYINVLLERILDEEKLQGFMGFVRLNGLCREKFLDVLSVKFLNLIAQNLNYIIFPLFEKYTLPDKREIYEKTGHKFANLYFLPSSELMNSNLFSQLRLEFIIVDKRIDLIAWVINNISQDNPHYHYFVDKLIHIDYPELLSFTLTNFSFIINIIKHMVDEKMYRNYKYWRFFISSDQTIEVEMKKLHGHAPFELAIQLKKFTKGSFEMIMSFNRFKLFKYFIKQILDIIPKHKIWGAIINKHVRYIHFFLSNISVKDMKDEKFRRITCRYYDKTSMLYLAKNPHLKFLRLNILFCAVRDKQYEVVDLLLPKFKHKIEILEIYRIFRDDNWILYKKFKKYISDEDKCKYIAKYVSLYILEQDLFNLDIGKIKKLNNGEFKKLDEFINARTFTK